MSAALAADAVLIFHLGFILFATFGALLLLRWPRLLGLHLPALAWGLWIELSHGVCPLTPLENALRRRAGEAGYDSGFIDHYLIPLIYPAGLQPTQQVLLAVLLGLLNLAIYAVVLARRLRRSSRRRSELPPSPRR